MRICEVKHDWQLTMLQKNMKHSKKKTQTCWAGSWILINPYSPSTFHIKFLHRSKVRPSWNGPGGLVGGVGWEDSQETIGSPARSASSIWGVLIDRSSFIKVCFGSSINIQLISVDPKVFIGNLGVFISQAAQALVATVTYCNTM